MYANQPQKNDVQRYDSTWTMQKRIQIKQHKGNCLTNKRALKTHVKPPSEWLMVKMTTNLSVKGVMTSLPEFPKYSYPYWNWVLVCRTTQSSISCKNNHPESILYTAKLTRWQLGQKRQLKKKIKKPHYTQCKVAIKRTLKWTPYLVPIQSQLTEPFKSSHIPTTWLNHLLNNVSSMHLDCNQGYNLLSLDLGQVTTYHLRKFV